MIRRLIGDAVEGLIGAPPELRRVNDLRDAVRSSAVRRPRPYPSDEESAPRRPPRLPEPVEPPPSSERTGLDLGSRAELRRAFLLMEILGPPVALRDRDDRFQSARSGPAER